MNRINAAFNNGPDLLIQTIETDLGIPISHYISVNFDGFQNMVGALGGLTMNFPDPVKDSYSGLRVSTTGCQSVSGATALELVRARHLYYEKGGEWLYDGLSDLSRIQRQDAFFRALLNKANGSITNPFAINAFLGAAVSNLTIDDTLGEGEILSLARQFHGIGESGLHTETLPTYSFTTAGGAAVLGEAQPYDARIISAFNALGTPVATTPPTTSTTVTSATPLVAPSSIRVEVLNGVGGPSLATTTGQSLRSIGYDVVSAGDAAQFGYTTSEIEYGTGGLEAAQTLASSLLGGAELISTPNLSGNELTLILGSSFTGVAAPAGSRTSTTSSTSTTIPANIYTNTNTEAWNPVPC
jgi:LCP family protein required for cell wall assembly